MNPVLKIFTKLEKKAFDKGIKDMKSEAKTVTNELNTGSEATTSIAGELTASAGAMVKIALIVGAIVLAIKTIVAGVKSVFKNNEEIYNKVRAIGEALTNLGTAIANAMGKLLQPIIEWIVNAIYTMLGYLNAILKAWFNIDLFVDNQKQRLKESNKEAKALKKTLAGFDTANILSDTSSKTQQPEPIKFQEVETPKWLEDAINVEGSLWTKIWNTITEVIKKINEWFGELLGGIVRWVWDGLVSLTKSIAEWFVGVVVSAKAKGISIGEEIINGVKTGIWNIIKNIGAWIMTNIVTPFINGFKKGFGIASPSKVMIEIGGYIVDGFIKGISNIWNKAKTVINNLKTNMVNAFKGIWDKVKEVFNGGPNLVGIKDSILSSLKRIINTLIDGINKIIAKPFEGLNEALQNIKKVNVLGAKPFSFIKTIQVPKIPKLAYGGIVNNPGKGVLMGNYIAGERGAEAVIPLTDDTLQRLANMIPITIDLTNKLDSRIIGKQIVNIDNEKRFARNGG